MSTVTLPRPLARRLAALSRRVRLLAATRGLGFTLTLLTLTGGMALLADWKFDLSAQVRQGMFSSWVGLGLACLFARIARPLCRGFSPAALAAIVEEKYPEIGERLTSCVELTGHNPEGHGSSALLQLLVHETQERTGKLDFRLAVPGRASLRWALAAHAAVLAVLVPAAVWPGEAAVLARRFFQPWYVPPAAPPFAFAIDPGDTFAARGRPLHLTARLEARDDKVVLPSTLTLVVVDAAGREHRQGMEPDGSGLLAVDYRVGGNCCYHVEAGDLSSDSFAVTAVTPVELAAESPTITITPPAYAAAQLDAETFHGFVDLVALKHSQVRFDFRFSRPAAGARLEWTTHEVKESKEGTLSTPTTKSQELALADGGMAGSISLAADLPASFRLLLQAEHGITTERDGGSLTVRPDQPPVFLKVNARDDMSAVLAYDRLPLEVRLADDVAVAGADLEYRVNGGDIQVEPLVLNGANSREAVGQIVFQLAAKVKEDDEVAYRFRARDNLPKEFDGPHTVYFPAETWLHLKVARKGQPLKPQEIASQRDEIGRRIDALRSELLKEQRGVYKTRQESREQTHMAKEQLQQLQQLQQDNDANQKALRELSQLAGNNPALEPVSEVADDLARTEMKATRSALDRAERRDEKLPARNQAFKDADKQLASALHRLDELKRVNDRLAQERLDQARLEELADRQKHLAERAAELIEKHPARDPKARELAENLRREQGEVAEELKKLTEQSEPLRQAMDEARAERAKEAAQRARELAQAQRELAEAAHDTERRRSEARFGELTRRQKDITKEAADLAERTRLAARSANTTPLPVNDLEHAEKDLEKGDTRDAVARQERAAKEMIRLSYALEMAAQVARDPSEAARQLAALQQVLRQTTEEEARRADGEKPLAERLKPLKAEQEALRRAAERLSVPPQNAAAVKERKDAAEKAAAAGRALEHQDPRQAMERMEQTRQALMNLADRLPRILERIGKAREEAGRLRKEQEAIAAEVAQVNKDDPDARRRLAEAARREAEVARKLEKMDTPNQDERKERVAGAVKKALVDLKEGRHEDLPLSQQEARRQLARLENALAGKMPPDELARDLARQQQDLARAAANPKATGQEKLDMRNKQNKLAEQAQGLQASDAPQRQREAATATRKAADASSEDPTKPEAQKAMKEAARKLDELARQLEGKESQAQRAQRLAEQQAQAAAEAQREAQARPGQEASEEARRRQEDIAQEARQIPGGKEARDEKAALAQALEKVEKAVEPAERARAQAQAADALRGLANRLAGRSDPTAKAQAIARAQRQIAEDAASRDPARPAPQDARKAAATQADLVRQVEKLEPQGNSQLAARRTAERMAQAQKSLQEARTPAEAREPLARAAEAAEDLARRLAKDSPLAGAKVRGASPHESDNGAAGPQGMPNREQYEQARDLARRQWELRNDVVAAMRKQALERPRQPGNLVGDLVREQQELARAVKDLEGQLTKRQGEDAPPSRQARQASQSTQEAARGVQAGALERALKAGTQAADQMRGVVKELAQFSGNSDKEDPLGQDAGQLAGRQDQLNRRMAKLARNPDDRMAQQQANQGELAQQAGELAQDLNRMAQEPGRSPQTYQAAKGASSATDHMRAAKRLMESGASNQAQSAQEQAAAALEQAADQTDQSGQAARAGKPATGQGRGEGEGKNSPRPGQQAGKAVQQAKGNMENAQGQLSQGQNATAQAAMQKAAGALQQAAQAMAKGNAQQPGQPGQPGSSKSSSAAGAAATGVPDLVAVGVDPAKFAGKTWGELPGELRTKIVQDAKAKYGEDYGRMIKMYFEQIASTDLPINRRLPAASAPPER
jgi:hypothetical protein